MVWSDRNDFSIPLNGKYAVVLPLDYGLFATGMPAACGMRLISLPQLHICVLNEGGCFTSVH